MSRPPDILARTTRRHGALAAAALWAALATAPALAGEPRLFRPLTADPRENQTAWRMVSYTEDWRYGTDVTDSTSRGGVIEDRRGAAWDVSAGETFRWMPLEHVGRWRGPWIRYQVGLPAGVFSHFDGSGSLINTDYQFGGSLDILWRGDYRADQGVVGFDHSVVTSRLQVFHRSSHVGDEYLAQGSFGRNQTTPPFQGTGLGRPPVKRMDLAYEAVSLVVSVERGGGSSPATLRAYAGGEAKIVLPAAWKIGGLAPRRFRSPAARFGLEYRSAAAPADPADGRVAALLAALTRAPLFGSEWLGAVDVRLARPFNFASCDDAAGETEAWTPRLWTSCPCGREFRGYAASWHGLVGTSITRRAARRVSMGGRRIVPEWIVALEWYRGYAPDGQFLDQRLRYRPRWSVIPSVTAHF